MPVSFPADTVILINPLERKQAKRTIVCSSSLACTQVINPFSGTVDGPSIQRAQKVIDCFFVCFKDRIEPLPDKSNPPLQSSHWKMMMMIMIIMAGVCLPTCTLRFGSFMKLNQKYYFVCLFVCLFVCSRVHFLLRMVYVVHTCLTNRIGICRGK